MNNTGKWVLKAVFVLLAGTALVGCRSAPPGYPAYGAPASTAPAGTGGHCPSCR